MQPISEFRGRNLAPFALLAAPIDRHARNAQRTDNPRNTKKLCPPHIDLDYYLDA